MADELRKHQLRALDCLCEVDSIFKEYGITYYLLAGTTLGAVRHKGFIPWDDDIDIAVPFHDVEKAYTLLSEKLSDDFHFIDNKLKPGFPRLYGKIIDTKTGLGYIDVFQLIKTSIDERQERKQWNMRKVLFKLYKAKLGYYNKNEIKGLSKKIKLIGAHILSLFYSKEKLMSMIHNNEIRFESSTPAQRYIILYGAHSMKNETIMAEWLEPASYVEFEGHIFPTVGNTDAYLKNMYGDYMTPIRTEVDTLRHDETFREV